MPDSADDLFFDENPFSGYPVAQLKIGQMLIELRHRYVKELVALEGKLDAERVPQKVRTSVLKIAAMAKGKTKKIREQLAIKQPTVSRLLELHKKILRIDIFLLSGLTEEQREERIERTTRLFAGTPPQLNALIYNALKKRVKGREAATRALVFKALQHKLEHRISWGQLAIKFFPDKGAAYKNSLHVQVLQLKKELVEVGLALPVKM